MLICSFTTLGKTFAATCSTEPSRGAARGGCGAGAAAVAAVAALLAADGSGWLASTAAPTPPDTTATPAAPTTAIRAREGLRCNGVRVAGVESGCCTEAYAPCGGCGCCVE